MSEQRTCSLCEAPILQGVGEITEKKKRRIIGILNNLSDAVCPDCFRPFAAQKNINMSREDYFCRTDVMKRFEISDDSVAVDRIIKGRGRISVIDKKISALLDQIQAFTKERNQVLATTMELEKEAVLDALKRYANRRSEANYKISNQQFRAMIFSRDGWKCKACSAIEALCVDHIIPVSKGGSDELDNLQTLCKSCNSRKGSKIDYDFSVGYKNLGSSVKSPVQANPCLSIHGDLLGSPSLKGEK
jgi:hypothetical protein